MKYQFRSAAFSDIGPRKEVNQDSWFSAEQTADGFFAGLYAVADGVSGSFHGEIASRFCVEAINAWWRDTFPSLEYKRYKIIPSITELIIGINSDVCQKKTTEGGRTSSTLTLLLLLNDEWFTFNVGDSRIYRLTRGLAGRFDQITEDHSCLVEREYNGEKYLKSVLTSCVGGRNAFKYSYSSGELRRGDRFLLCSDGVYKTQSAEQIKKALRMKKATPEAVSKMLIEDALSNGETDNITAVTVFVDGQRGQ